jgi:PAS domain S-box-containing protein
VTLRGDELQEEALRVLCQAAFDGLIVHEDLRVVEATERCASLFGMTVAEGIGRSIFDLIVPEEHEHVREQIRGGQVWGFETTCRRPDGTTFPVEVWGVSMPGTTRRVVALRDLSARRAADAAVAATNDRYRDLVENSHELIGTHDLDGRILSVNPAVASALRMDVQTLVGMDLRQFLWQPEHFAGYIDELQRDGEAAGTMLMRAADGTLRTWEFRNTLRREGVATPVVRAIVSDVTDRVEANRALRRSEELFRSIIESVSDFISIIQPGGEIHYPSPSVETLLGRTPDDLTGRRFLELVHPEDVPAANGFLHAQRGHPDACEMIALRLQHANGTWRHFEVAAKNVVHNGRVAAIVATARDITDRKLLEKQLEQAHRLTSLGRLAATVAHEFNNVLMGMAPFAELMQRPSISAEVVTRGARHIATSIGRGKRIVQDLLRFTQPAEPDLKPLNLARWWETLGGEMRAMLSNDITIAAELCAALPNVVADAGQLAQVFANLIANARDAMPRGGTITISAEQPRAGAVYPFGVVQRPETFTHLTVADTGCGIAPELLHHVFDPLFTTKTNGGTGLGLAVAHQVVTRSGGHIFVESEPGRGSIFHLFLRNAGWEEEEGACQAASPRSITARRLLMVEDEPSIVEGVAELFTEAGIRVDSVMWGEQAAEAVERYHPDVVIMDISLPGIDGLEAYRRIRIDHPSLPIVFSTGHADGSKMSNMLADRRTRFLQKPFEFSALLDTIAELESIAS